MVIVLFRDGPIIDKCGELKCRKICKMSLKAFPNLIITNPCSSVSPETCLGLLPLQIESID